MSVTVTTTEFRVFDLETRMPFHFGNVSVSEIPKVFLRIEADIDGTSQTGTAMGGLIPGWFYKDPAMGLVEGLENMVETFQKAAETARTLDAQPTAFGFWRTLYARQEEWAAETSHPPLLWGYGVSMVEQALIDAVCRSQGTSFGTAVRKNTLGIDPGAIYPELSGVDPTAHLPTAPRRSTAVRHTVGLGDPLTTDDLSPDERLDDGLPQTLAQYVREDGVRYFKIKLSADHDRDADRLARIRGILEDLGVEDYRCSVDANEGYDSAGAFKQQWESLRGDPTVRPLLERLAYVEQPLARDDAFTDETAAVFTTWDEAPPIIIDESDARIDSAGRALEYGYAGTSHKNCKGVFKGLVNACLVAKRARDDPAREYRLSAEDLTTTGPIELLQDLAVVATLGLDHVERNGHHYFRGLDSFPAGIQERTLEAHGDLYRRHADGYPTVAVQGGRLNLDSVVEAPFGAEPSFELDGFPTLDAWLADLA